MVGMVAAGSSSLPDVDSRLKKNAQEFEAMLLADLMKLGSGDDQSANDPDQSCHGYDDLRNQAVATALAQNGGIGIGRMLLKSLGQGGQGHET